METATTRQPLYARDLEPRIGEFADRIVALYGLATADERSDGRTWYQRCSRFVETLAKNYGRTVADVAGIMSVLSPATTLEQNIIDLCNVMAEDDDRPVGTYGPQYLKALAIRDLGIDPVDVLGENKTAAFWANIVNPNEPGRVTVDRHAARVAAGWQMSPDDAYYFTNTPKKYGIMERAYKRAAERLGLLPHELQAITWLVYKRLFVPKQRKDSADVIPF